MKVKSKNLENRRCSVKMRTKDKYFLKSKMSQRLSKAWASFLKKLDRIVRFKWYATLTFRFPTPVEKAKKCFERWIHKINRKKFGTRYYKKHKGIHYVIATEYQQRGVVHLHCLIADVEDQTPSSWAKEWNKIAGFAKIEPYDRNLGACYYLSKCVKKDGEIDISSNFSVAMQ